MTPDVLNVQWTFGGNAPPSVAKAFPQAPLPSQRQLHELPEIIQQNDSVIPAIQSNENAGHTETCSASHWSLAVFRNFLPNLNEKWLPFFSF